MVLAFGAQMTFLQMVLLVLFAVTFTWVGFWFLSMIAGLFAPRLVTPAGPNAARIAVVMPVYNEDAVVTAGLLASLARDLYRVGLSERAEIFVISDSRKPDAVFRELVAISRLRDVLGAGLVSAPPRTSRPQGWQRRRFRPPLGRRYDQMVVLGTLEQHRRRRHHQGVVASARMNADPAVGLIQTMPMLVGGQTIFARLTQFAGRIYGPAIARGVAAWSGDSGNFYGATTPSSASAHSRNAAACPSCRARRPLAARSSAMTSSRPRCCAAPAAKVRLDHDLRQSFEGSPPSLLDMAVRERRWAQGNLQHARLIFSRGFAWISRAHFVIGILGFLDVAAMAGDDPCRVDAVGQCAAVAARLFPADLPDVPELADLRSGQDAVAVHRGHGLPAGAEVHRHHPGLAQAAGQGFGRQGAGLLGSAMFEIVLSTLIAPVQMLIQTRQISRMSSAGAIPTGRHRSVPARCPVGAWCCAAMPSM